MSDTETTTEPTTTDGESDKDRNWRKMEEQLAELRRENDELRPLKVDKAIRDAGFDPDSERGKSLGLAVDAGKVEADQEKITEYANEFFGWQPEKRLSETETQQVNAAQRQQQIQTVTESEQTPDIKDQIAKAEADGNWTEAMRLKMSGMAQSGG